MATELIYNSVHLYQVITRSFEQEAVLDPSGTDVLFYKFRIAVSGLINGVADSATAPQSVPTSNSINSANAAADNHKYIRQALMASRRPFRMYTGATAHGLSGTPGTNGTLLVGCDPPSGKTLASPDSIPKDLNNGPHPKSLRILKITGNNTFVVEFEIEFAVTECGAPVTGPVPSTRNETGVLSHRWSVADDIEGDSFYTTRTVQGTIRVASADLNPHSFRNWAVCTPDPGFKVERMNFTATPDGLNLSYTLVFRELAFAAPPPATSWSLSHAETFGQTTGFLANTAVNVMLKAPRAVNKRDLFTLAAKIIAIKAFGLNKPPKPGEQSFIIQEISLEDFYSDKESYISARALVRHLGNDNPNQNSLDDMMALYSRKLGTPLENYDVQKGVDPASVNIDKMPGGSASILKAFSAYYQSACSTVHDRQSAGVVPSLLTIATSDLPKPTIGISEAPTEQKTDYSDDHKKALYTTYRAEAKYVTNENKIQLPFAGRPSIATGDSRGTIPSDHSSTVATVAAATAFRVIRVHAQRVGESPVMPQATSFTDSATGVLYTLLDSVVLAVSPDKAPDGQFLHTADIEYRYALSRPLTPQEQLRTVQPPWLREGVATSASDATNTGMKAAKKLLSGPSP